MAILNFDANSVPAATDDFETVPAGWYKVIISKSDLKPTSNKDGSRLHLFFKVIEGDMLNRMIYVAVTWDNPSEQAMQIGRGKVGAICKALGLNGVSDSGQLHNNPFWLKVSYSAANDKYPAQNDIRTAKGPHENPEDGGGYSAPAQTNQAFTPPPAQQAPAQQANYETPAPMTGGYPNNAQAPAAPDASMPWNNGQQPAQQPWNNAQPAPQQPAPQFQAPAQAPAFPQGQAPGNMPWQQK